LSLVEFRIKIGKANINGSPNSIVGRNFFISNLHSGSGTVLHSRRLLLALWERGTAVGKNPFASS